MKGELSTLRHLYKDVINGYSKVDEENIYIRHLRETDIGHIEERKAKLTEEAKQKGLEDEDEKIKLLISEGLWAQVKEDDIEKLKKEIGHLRESKKKLILGRQIKQFSKTIERKEKLFSDLYKERTEEVGFTAEQYADKKVNEEIVKDTFFKSQELRDPFFSEEKFEEMTSRELEVYSMLYNAVNSQFSDKILKKISVCPFFVNSFFVCDNNCNLFFGKPVVQLTNYQIDIFSYGKYYKSIMAECKSPPNELYQTPEKLIEYYENTKAAREAKESKKGLGGGKQSEYMGSTVFGASKEELQSMASANEEESSMVDFSKEAEKSGGDMGINEFLKLHKK